MQGRTACAQVRVGSILARTCAQAVSFLGNINIWNRSHAQIGKRVEDQEVRGAQHAAVQERVEYLEKLVGDSADKHAK